MQMTWIGAISDQTQTRVKEEDEARTRGKRDPPPGDHRRRVSARLPKPDHARNLNRRGEDEIEFVA